MNWRLNKGDWAEAYVFCKLLADGRIYAGDKDLQKIADVYMDIIKVIRKNAGKDAEYLRQARYVVASEDGVDFVTVALDEFENATQNLKVRITEGGQSRAFDIPEAQDFLSNKLHINNIKEKCVADASDDKTDILVEVLNSTDGSREKVGFSIKSHFGSPATLFNCSQASKLVYKINGCDEHTMYLLNSMKNSVGGADVDARVQYIAQSPSLSLEFLGSKIIKNQFYGDQKETGEFFRWNLEHYDGRMLDVFSSMLLSSYGYYGERSGSSMNEVGEAVASRNPLQVHNPCSVYEAKFKDFLYNAFAGLTASKKWNGVRKINGGYIDVKKDGEILYYRAVSDDQFTSYLFNSVRLERPEHGCICKLKIAEAEQKLSGIPIPATVLEEASRSARKKGDYGYVYKDTEWYDGNPYCIDLNYSFRFKK